MALELVTAICDACVLYPFHLRNILVQASVDGLYEARWTDEIHDEWTRNLLANVPAIPPERLQITRRLMEAALPGARIDGYHHHIDKVALPDLDDRHIVAAALQARASRILTWNLRDFPVSALRNLGLVRQTPDVFLAELYEQTPQHIVASLANARRDLSKSGVTPRGFLDVLKEQKLPQLEKRLRKHAADL
jgi:hypothetical protein